MNRIRNSWPYALGVLGMYAILWGCNLVAHSCGYDGACVGMSGLDWKTFFLGLMFAVFPTIAFAGAALLGFRRGYDWVTILVALSLWVVVPEPEFNGASIDLGWTNKDLVFLVAYAIILNLGVTIGMTVRALIRHLNRRSTPVRQGTA